ncbi:WYL domain-containing protein, partial [Paenibacillus sepulcri]|nr:WYL domain-containing protein [Paenibacillus sepulcri]
LPADYQTRIDGLTTPEIHALFLSVMDTPLRQLGIGESLRSALLKLLNALPNQNRQDAEWIRNRIYLDTDLWHPRKDNAAFIRSAQLAIWEEKQAVVSYTTRAGNEITRTIKPYGLVAKSGIWFIIGGAGDKTQAYRLSRIRSFQMTDEPFSRPEGFDLQVSWQEWVARFESREASYPVVVEVAEAAIPFLSREVGVDVLQQGGQSHSSIRSGWKRFTLSFENETAARGRMFALGLQVEVIHPAELRQSLRDHAAEILRIYS